MNILRVKTVQRTIVAQNDAWLKEEGIEGHVESELDTAPQHLIIEDNFLAVTGRNRSSATPAEPRLMHLRE